MKAKQFIFSETYENYSIDDYIKQNDTGAWYYVVTAKDFSSLMKQAVKLREVIELHLTHEPGFDITKHLTRFDEYIKDQDEKG